MKSRESLKREASPSAQLDLEFQSLAGMKLAESWRPIAEWVKNILQRPELARFLNILEHHNRSPNIIRGRRLPVRSPHFLLAPHIFQVLLSVEGRHQLVAKLPALDQPAADVRAHLGEVSVKCRALAAVMRTGPQPYVALAARTDANAGLKVFAPWTEFFEASDDSHRQVVAFAELMERAAGWFDALADHVPRAKHNRHTGAGALRLRAAEFLPAVFRKGLGHPYHAHVANIATIISGIETDADFVKKVERRRTGPRQKD